MSASGIVDTGGKFATGINNTAVPVAKFDAGVIDTGGTTSKFAAGVVDIGGAPWLADIFENFQDDSKKKPEAKNFMTLSL